MITIDGSAGEGGGQILRTALSLAVITRQPFRIDKIRAGRKKPGLLRQHLTAVQASAQISQARVDGATVGSLQLTFTPATLQSGMFHFAIGTAGSATLVLQTILPALALADGPSDLILEGGTHNPFAPPFDFLQQTFIPILNRMGPQVAATLERPGFYPAGGGRIQVHINPAAHWHPLEILERGEIQHRRVRALVAALPRNIAERELKAACAGLSWPEELGVIEILDASRGPGNILLVEIGSAQVLEVFTGFGERGVPAEKVADSVVEAARAYLAAKTPVGEHLADQLLLPFALAGGGSFKTQPLSRHSHTNMEIIQRFLPVKITLRELENRNVQVSFQPA